MITSSRRRSLFGRVAIFCLCSAIATGLPVRRGQAADPPQPTQAEAAQDFLATTRAMADELAKEPDVVVAEIAGHPVTRGEVSDAFRALSPVEGNRPFETVYRTVVQRLLREQALVIRARQKGLDKDKATLRQVQEAEDKALANAFLRLAIMPAITDKLLHETYDREVAGKPGPVEVQARIIMTYTLADAESAQAQLASGADFADVARRMSKDSTAGEGGEIGFVRQDAVTPEVGAVLFALAPGQVTAFPVHVGGNWLLLQVESRRQLGTPNFAAVKERLTDELLRAGVPTVMQAAMTGLAVQDYGMAGKPATPAKP